MSLSTPLSPSQDGPNYGSRLRHLVQAIAEDRGLEVWDDSPRDFEHYLDRLVPQGFADIRLQGLIELLQKSAKELDYLTHHGGFFLFLRDLSKCDFRQRTPLVELCDTLFMGRWPLIPLVDHHIPLGVHIDAHAFDSEQIGPMVVSSTGDDLAPKDDLRVHPCLLSLSLLESSTRLSSTSLPLPKFIFPLGRLVTHPDPPINSAEDEQESNEADEDYEGETGYVVVIDISSRERGVWIVFSHYLRDGMGERMSVDYADVQKPFPDVKENFAVAMITPSLLHWVDGRLDTNDVMKNIRDSMRFGMPRLSKTVGKEVLAALD